MSRALDPTQLSYLSEECILVDENDRQIGSATKRDAHNWANVEKGGCLHRAFSVFIFNSKKEMLLQKRSKEKITFPEVWTNACCSHPLNRDSERDGVKGIVSAAKRKLTHEFVTFSPTETNDSGDSTFDMHPEEPNSETPTMPFSEMAVFELGLTAEELSPELIPLTRVLYKARCPAPQEDWGEHELDHVLFLTDFDIPPRPNLNEVAEVSYVSESELYSQLESGTFSPWFRLIARHFLPEWWRNLDTLPRVAAYDTIHRFA